MSKPQGQAAPSRQPPPPANPPPANPPPATNEQADLSQVSTEQAPDAAAAQMPPQASVPQTARQQSRAAPAPHPLPRSDRRVAIQEHPLFQAKLRWFIEQDKTLLLNLLEQGNDVLTAFICNQVIQAVKNMVKVQKEKGIGEEPAMELARQELCPPVDAPMLPKLKEKRLEELLAEYQQNLPSSRPRFFPSN